MKRLLLVVFFAINSALAQPRVEVIPTDQLNYSVYKANPWSNKPAPTVMLGHGCAGVINIQVQDFVHEFNRWGYNVVVVDSWTPRGINSVCKLKQPYYHPPARMQEFYDVAKIISNERWHNGRLGYIGFSHGGSLGLSLAGEGQIFQAVVSYYPGCGPNAVKDRRMKIPTQLHISNGDTWTPAEQCDTIYNVTERVVHKDATHAWDVRAPDRIYLGEPLRYHAQADRISKEATRRFFDTHLK